MDTTFIYAAEWREIAKKSKTMVVTCHKIKYRIEAVRTDDIGYIETGERTKVTIVEILYARGADVWKRSRRNILKKRDHVNA